MRRLASIVALVAIDVGGLASAVYLALVLRNLYYGVRPVLWGLPWKAEVDAADDQLVRVKLREHAR